MVGSVAWMRSASASAGGASGRTVTASAGIRFLSIAAHDQPTMPPPAIRTWRMLLSSISGGHRTVGFDVPAMVRHRVGGGVDLAAERLHRPQQRFVRRRVGAHVVAFGDHPLAEIDGD